MKSLDLGSDHASLRDALARAEGALVAMESGVANGASRYTPRHLRPIRMAWDAFAEKLANHLDSEERIVHPAIRHALAGHHGMSSALSSSIAQMMQAHEELDELARQLRITLPYCPQVAGPLERVIDRFHAHAHLEDTSHYAQVLGYVDSAFSLQDTPVPQRRRTIHDLDRALRTPRPVDQRQTLPEESGKRSWLTALLRTRQ